MYEFTPEHISNKMKKEGYVVLARKTFLNEKNNNLEFLLYKRFDWMNHYIKKGFRVIYLGSGAGLIEFFIKEKILLTDIKKQEFIHKKINALNIDLPNNSVDVFICSHMIHHISHPVKFLKSLERKLVDGGLILIQDKKLFEKKVPLKILKNSLNQFLLLPLSGGVIAKSKTIELPIFVSKLIDTLNKAMIYFFPKLFAFGRSVV
tara:strand:- start:3086 stop:3700 length:615 start_codon:yes stop_codon:yes gene_type:complete